MPVIDDRGRLFGRFNLIDVMVIVVVLGLIPLAYGAFFLFRIPTPTIISVEPARATQGEQVTLQVTGENLRPFLRAQLGTSPSMVLLVQSPTSGEFKVPDLPPGTYDLALFDEARELVRVTGAFTVAAPAAPAPPAPPAELPSIELQVVGEFVGLAQSDARLIQAGLEFQSLDAPPIGRALLVRPIEPSTSQLTVGPNATITIVKPGEVRRPGIVRLRCRLIGATCQVDGVVLAPGATITLPLPFAPDDGGADADRADRVTFVVGEVRAADAPVRFPSRQIEVRAVGDFVDLASDDAERIHVGMIFAGRSGEPVAEVLAARAPEAGVRRVRAGSAVILVPEPGGGVQVPALIRVTCAETPAGRCQVGEVVLARDATILLRGPNADGVAAGSDQIRFVIKDVLPSNPPTLLAPARVDIQVVGEFFGLTRDDLRFVEVGSRFERWKDEPFAEVLAVRTPEPGMRRVRMGGIEVWTPVAEELRVRGIVRMSCVITGTEECMVGDTVLAGNTTIRLPVPRRPGHIKFLIDEIRPADAPAELSSVRTAVAIVRVRFVAGQEVLDVMTVGDLDVNGPEALADADRAELTAIGGDQRPITAFTNTQGLLRRSIQIEEPVLSFTGTIRVPVVFKPAGWSYGSQVVKVGAAFIFETVSGAMMGWVLDMEVTGDQVHAVR